MHETTFLSYESADGDQVLFAVADADVAGVELVGRRDGDVIVTGEALERALGAVRSATSAVFANVADAVRPPDELEIEFGLQMNAKLGAVIASSEAQGHLKVRMKWDLRGRAD